MLMRSRLDGEKREKTRSPSQMHQLQRQTTKSWCAWWRGGRNEHILKYNRLHIQRHCWNINWHSRNKTFSMAIFRVTRFSDSCNPHCVFNRDKGEGAGMSVSREAYDLFSRHCRRNFIFAIRQGRWKTVRFWKLVIHDTATRCCSKYRRPE